MRFAVKCQKNVVWFLKSHLNVVEFLKRHKMWFNTQFHTFRPVFFWWFVWVCACAAVLLCAAVCCRVLPCAAVCCCVLLCAAVYCSVRIKYVCVCVRACACAAVYCTKLLCTACSVLQCSAVWFAAVHCSALQCVTVCYRPSKSRICNDSRLTIFLKNKSREKRSVIWLPLCVTLTVMWRWCMTSSTKHSVCTLKILSRLLTKLYCSACSVLYSSDLCNCDYDLCRVHTGITCVHTTLCYDRAQDCITVCIIMPIWLSKRTNPPHNVIHSITMCITLTYANFTMGAAEFKQS